MAEVDYYQTLGIQKTATEDEIKRAYRKLAVRFHPDKNLDNKEEAEVKFKEIGEAYSVLSDVDKRRQYDRFGKAGVGGGMASSGSNRHPFQGQDAEEIFRSFFGGQDPFSMFSQESMRGGGGMHNFGGSRVHVSQFGPGGFSFASFGGAPGMGMGMGMPGMRVHRGGQQQRVPGGPNNGGHNAGPQANGRLSPYRIGGGNVLLLFFLLWFLGVPFSYLWVALMLFSYLGLV
ncbi:unnamed protein product [Hyaloperonospora brassicae]|uniref:J domain-containing protein n=1 Tax=Hyaloperonospora brassicae TaxID=162125 RepID=A0AAV0V4R0_HYABA|nr:unnamed protein product [Hyaloperonospora brassicae]